uniref:Protein PXR1-like n=1 Tax=Diabrotica virgifera virgifera TaxID=50390 RepID=A0A6P7G7C2_DIAVI
MTDRARSRSPPPSMATPPKHADSRKVDRNLFQELAKLQSEKSDGYSTIDEQRPENKGRREKDREFKFPRRNKKKKEKSKEKGSDKKDEDNPKEKPEAMEEEVPDEVDRGTTKRPRVINTDDKSDEDDSERPRTSSPQKATTRATSSYPKKRRTVRRKAEGKR